MRVGVDRIRHRIGRHSCSKLASRLLPGSRYRSSPVRLMLIPTHGVLPTVPRAGLTVGSSPSNNAAQRSAETAVSASQTSSTPDLKLRPPAANESTNRANARLQECVALPEGARCPLLAQSGHTLVHCKCPLMTQSGHVRPNPVPAAPTDSWHLRSNFISEGPSSLLWRPGSPRHRAQQSPRWRLSRHMSGGSRARAYEYWRCVAR